MQATTTPRSNGQAGMDRLVKFEDPLADADPVSFLRSLAAAASALGRNPVGTASANARMVLGLAAALRAAAGRAIGRDTAGPVSPPKGDRRFTDPAYDENPLYFLLEQQYLLLDKLVTELLDAARLEPGKDAKARFAAKFILAALAPTNTLPGNPAALREVFDTGGKSLIRGAKNMLGDIQHNGGWPSQVDDSGFEVGVNLAATPGQVVYRSELIELIHYEPQGRAGALGAAVVLPTVDQQVLHHGPRPREEPDRVGSPARSQLLRHQLSQP